LSHQKQMKNDKTIFPVDFFKGNRISDPNQRHHMPKISISKEVKYKPSPHHCSPKNGVLNSESTSAISRENEMEELIKFPPIRWVSKPEKLQDFKFPFKRNNRSIPKNTERMNDFKGDSLRNCSQPNIDDISPNIFIENTIDLGAQNATDRSVNPRIGPKRISSSGAKYNKGQIDNSMEKSKSLGKSMISSRVSQKAGYETERTLKANKSQFSTPAKYSKYTPNDKEKNEILNHSKLPAYDPSSEEEENELMFDIMNENDFEELWKLADDGDSLPDIFERNPETLIDTFGHSKDEVRESSSQYMSFDEILKKDKESKFVPNTIQHTSEKVNELEVTPFKFSQESPTKWGQSTAYFGTKS